MSASEGSGLGAGSDVKEVLAEPFESSWERAEVLEGVLARTVTLVRDSVGALSVITAVELMVG